MTTDYLNSIKKFKGDTSELSSFIETIAIHVGLRDPHPSWEEITNFQQFLESIKDLKSLEQTKRNKDVLKDFSDKYKKYYQVAYLTLRSCIEEDIFRAINHDVSKRQSELKALKDHHDIEPYIKFRSLLETLEFRYSPNVRMAFASSEAKIALLPVTASIVEIVDAINVHMSEVSRLAKIDEDGKTVLDATGNKVYMEINQLYMITQFNRLLNDPTNQQKSAIFNKMIESNHKLSFDTIFNLMVQYAQNAKLNPYAPAAAPAPAVFIPSAPMIPSAAPPNLLANFTSTAAQHVARHDVDNVPPYKTSYRQRCYNCNQENHRVNHCASPRCGVCNRVFPSVDERLRHWYEVHEPQQRKPSHKEHRSHHSGNDNRRRSDSRSREERRSHSHSRSRSRSHSHDHRSSSHRRSHSNERRGSSSSKYSSAAKHVTMANSAQTSSGYNNSKYRETSDA